jgi:hypothetical protein
MRPKNREDFWSGLMFAAAGAGFAIGATNYSMGSSVRPGPGYFPLGLGLLLGLIGLVIIGKSFLARSGEAPMGPIRWRPLVIVVVAIVVFGLALPRLGMAVTLPLLIAVISTASDQFRWREVLINSLVLTVGSWAVFIKGLQLTIPVWPAFMS